MSLLLSTTELDWTDQYGAIAADVYAVAQSLWPQLEAFARRTLGDPQMGQQLLMKACAAVTRVQAQNPEQITDLAAYLTAAWKRLVLAEYAKQKQHQQREQEFVAQVTTAPTDVVAQLEQDILIAELMAHMDVWTRTVFEYQVLGHTFEEMSVWFGTSGHVIRTRFNKNLKKLRHQIALLSHK